jgi:hypothetical protein
MSGGFPYADRGVELTRGFKALKAWMTFKAYGVNQIAQCVGTCLTTSILCDL